MVIGEPIIPYCLCLIMYCKAKVLSRSLSTFGASFATLFYLFALIKVWAKTLSPAKKNSSNSYPKCEKTRELKAARFILCIV